MTKTELIAALAQGMGADRKTAAAALDALAALATRTVTDGGTLNLPGIARIVCKDRPARMVRNPATGNQVHKPADRQVKVTAARVLKDLAAG